LAVELHSEEERFNLAVEDALVSMTQLVENPDFPKGISDMVEAQRKFYQVGFESFSSIII
jgi:hypothetical protein